MPLKKPIVLPAPFGKLEPVNIVEKMRELSAAKTADHKALKTAAKAAKKED